MMLCLSALIIVGLATGPTVTLGDGTQCTLPATYLYDATSGFYYDSNTGLYFDPKSQVNCIVTSQYVICDHSSSITTTVRHSSIVTLTTTVKLMYQLTSM